MANIVIVSTTNSIQVDFGVYSTTLEHSKGVWRKENISFQLATNYIEATIVGEKIWYVSDDGNSISRPTFQIDTVDASAPISLLDLFNKLQTLLT